MVKVILTMLIISAALLGKNGAKACLPMGELVVLKKSIMSLELTKEQKNRLAEYEETLKTSLMDIKNDALNKEARLSELFDEKQFLQQKFIKITTEQNRKITHVVAQYFDRMYKTLNAEQRKKLIKRFKQTEKRRARKMKKEH